MVLICVPEKPKAIRVGLYPSDPGVSACGGFIRLSGGMNRWEHGLAAR